MANSILYIDGFDQYSTVTQRWDFTGSNPTLTSAAARNGSKGLSLGNTAWVGKLFSSRATYIIGFAYQCAALPAANRTICAFYDGTTNQVELRLTNAGTLQFARNGTTIGSASTLTLSTGAWHYVEVKVTIDPSAGVAEAKVDGVSFLALSSQNTRASSNSTANRIYLGEILNANSSANSLFYDDFYVMDPTAGGAYSTYLGDQKVVPLLPTSNGTSNQWSQAAASWSASTVMSLGQQIIDSNGALQQVTAITGDFKTGSGSHPTWASSVGVTTTDNHVTWTLIQKATLSNFNFVNEVPPDDDQSYIVDSTVGHIDRYLMTTLSGSGISAVAVNIRADKDDVGTRSIRAQIDSGGTIVDNGTDIALTQNTYQTFQNIWETDPNTSAAWTSSGVNAAEFGVKLTA